jgi:hypothetical protein
VRVGKILNDLGFWGNGSEKGSTRKSIGNWVARWRNVFGGIMGFTLIPEENWVGG